MVAPTLEETALTRFHALLAALFLLPAMSVAEESKPLVHDNLHYQDWFHPTDGDLRKDWRTAGASGKMLMIIWEQDGCLYCEVLHEENFERAEIRQLLQENFVIVQLDMYGKNTVTDIDGQTVTEEQLARKWYVNATPTTIALLTGNPDYTQMVHTEVYRFPGYLEPFDYFAATSYFLSDEQHEMPILAYMEAMAEDFASRGVDIASW